MDFSSSRRMVQNLVWASGYSAFAIPLAAECCAATVSCRVGHGCGPDVHQYGDCGDQRKVFEGNQMMTETGECFKRRGHESTKNNSH